MRVLILCRFQGCVLHSRESHDFQVSGVDDQHLVGVPLEGAQLSRQCVHPPHSHLACCGEALHLIDEHKHQGVLFLHQLADLHESSQCVDPSYGIMYMLIRICEYYLVASATVCLQRSMQLFSTKKCVLHQDLSQENLIDMHL